MKNLNEKSCKQLIMEALEEKQTFDLVADNNGYPTIHWLIAEYILRKLNPFERNSRLYNGFVAAIKRNLDAAIKYLEEVKKIPVYKGREDSKEIQYITLDEFYRNAKEQDFKRINNRIKRQFNAGKKHIEFKYQNRLPEFYETLFLPAILKQPKQLKGG